MLYLSNIHISGNINGQQYPVITAMSSYWGPKALCGTVLAFCIDIFHLIPTAVQLIRNYSWCRWEPSLQKPQVMPLISLQLGFEPRSVWLQGLCFFPYCDLSGILLFLGFNICHPLIGMHVQGQSYYLCTTPEKIVNATMWALASPPMGTEGLQTGFP